MEIYEICQSIKICNYLNRFRVIGQIWADYDDFILPISKSMIIWAKKIRLWVIMKSYKIRLVESRLREIYETGSYNLVTDFVWHEIIQNLSEKWRIFGNYASNEEQITRWFDLENRSKSYKKQVSEICNRSWRLSFLKICQKLY